MTEEQSVPAATGNVPGRLCEAHPELAVALEAGRITGEVGTPRENNLSHIHRFLDQERQFDFGVELTQEWDYEKVFALMVEKVGLRPDPKFTEGVDTISTERCIAALVRFGDVLGSAVAAEARILFATGHPGGMLPVHMAFADWAAENGAEVISPDGYIAVPEIGGDLRRIGGVGVWHQHGGVPHTHLAEPMGALLDELTTRGEEAPDLVVADHGWAGCAGTRGVRSIGFADCNDPALFVAEAQGQVEVSVPLDDDVVPQLYQPLIDFVLTTAARHLDG